MTVNPERDYVLGTHDAEIERLGAQHAAWREFALLAWQHAGFAAGQTLIDVGSGPGYASLDLAAIAGPGGKVIALERSHRFLEVLRERAARAGVTALETHELDLDRDVLPVRGADGAWARWVFTFLHQPRAALARVAAALRPGGRLVLHEYYDYASWQSVPRVPEIDHFVATVIETWRADGGEPDIALKLLSWLRDSGLELVSALPIVRVLRPGEPGWSWLRSYLMTGPDRLVALGRMTAEQAARLRQAVLALETSGDGLMIAPSVMEIVAERR